MKKRVTVIGAGASGMVAGIAAARKGHLVRILERTGKPGKKILITGNGRCNLTNESISFQNYYHGTDFSLETHPKFVTSVFSRYSKDDIISFFHSLGLATQTESDGRIFPRSNQAQSVVDVLKFELDELNVPILYNKRVETIYKRSKGFLIECTTGKKYHTDAIIIATGGKSYPITGSSGDGFQLAESLGHTIVPPTAASVPIQIKSPLCHALQGVKPDVKVSIKTEDKVLAENTGTIMFAHFGVSGPAVMEISRTVGKFKYGNDKAPLLLQIDFFPEYTKSQVDELLQTRFQEQPKKTLQKSFIGLLISKIAPALFDYHNIDGSLPVSKVTKEQRQKIVRALTGHTETILGTMNWDIAQFTAGGVDLREIHSQSMESKVLPGIYFAGEVVDIDGQSGGYNLQWAWSSGLLAGNSC